MTQNYSYDDPVVRISLVVPIRNEEDSLGALIRSIVSQTRPPDEVVLVDGGSTDQTVALAKKLTENDLRFQILEAGVTTPGGARNVGISSAKNEWIALTDAGIQLEPNWLQELSLVVTHNSRIDIVYGNYEPVTTTWFERCADLAYVPPKQLRPGGMMRGRFIASSLLRRSVWQHVGGFPDLRAAEDLIFMERVEASSFQIGWAPTATVHWQIQPTLVRTFQRFALYSKHNVWAGRQRHWHYGVRRLYVIVAVLIALAASHSGYWLIVLALGALLRVVKTVWSRRDGRSVVWALNPFRLFSVGMILLVIDAATFVGWLQALQQVPPKKSVDERHASEDKTSGSRYKSVERC
ncbi:MAG: glycosyltransferase [Planctomycetes bacterium]|nr:glycosyltransferase [Planctomycetota bacterium]